MRRQQIPLPTSALIALFLCCGDAIAQRVREKVEWQKRTVEIQYESVSFGKHTLAELPHGGVWRMGANNASTLIAEAPLYSGEMVVPPGSYRVKIQRGQGQQFGLLIEGAGYELASGSSLRLDGSYLESKQPAEKLKLHWKSPEQQTGKINRDVELVIQYGPHELNIPVRILGTTTRKIKGWTLDAYAVPAPVLAARMKGGQLTVVASLSRKGKPKKGAPKSFNLLLGEDHVVLLPAQVAPTDSFGFGPIQPPAEEWTVRGEVKWYESQTEQPHFHLESLESTRKKQMQIEAQVGRRTAVILIAPPTQPRKSSTPPSSR